MHITHHAAYFALDIRNSHRLPSHIILLLWWFVHLRLVPISGWCHIDIALRHLRRQITTHSFPPSSHPFSPASSRSVFSRNSPGMARRWTLRARSLRPRSSAIEIAVPELAGRLALGACAAVALACSVAVPLPSGAADASSSSPE